MRTVKTIIKTIIFCAIIFSVVYFLNIFRENEVLKKIIERLSADARIAEVMVTHVKTDPTTKKTYTTIKGALLVDDAGGYGKRLTFST